MSAFGQHHDDIVRMYADQADPDFMRPGTGLPDGVGVAAPLPLPPARTGYPHNLAFLGDGTVIHDGVVITKAPMVRIGRGCRIDGLVKLEGGRELDLSDWIHIASFAHLNVGGGTLRMGPYSCVASHGQVITGGNRPDGITMSACAPIELQVLKPRDVTIGAFAAVLSGAVVMASMGQGAVAAAGAVVTQPIPAWEIWAGCPARKIGDRDFTGRDAMLARARALAPGVDWSVW